MWVFAYGSLIWRVDFPYERRVRCFVRGHLRRLWQGSSTHRGTPERPGRIVTLVPHPIPPVYLQVRDCLDSLCVPSELRSRGKGEVAGLSRETETPTQEDGVARERETPRVWGVAYLLDDSNRERVLAQLDERERTHLRHFRRVNLTCYPAQFGFISSADSELPTTHPHPVFGARPAFDPELDCDWLASPFEALTYVGDTHGPNYLGPASVSAIAERVASSDGPSGTNSEYVLELVRALRHLVPRASEPTVRVRGDKELARWDSHLLAVDARLRSTLGLADGEDEAEAKKTEIARRLPLASNPSATANVHQSPVWG